MKKRVDNRWGVKKGVRYLEDDTPSWLDDPSRDTIGHKPGQVRAADQSALPRWAASSPWVIGRGPGAIAKASKSGEFIGWYRSDQRSGKPSSKHPIERELAAIEGVIHKGLKSAAQRFNKQLAQQRSLSTRGYVTNRALQLFADYNACGVPPIDITAAIKAQLAIEKIKRSRRQIQRIVKSAR